MPEFMRKSIRLKMIALLLMITIIPFGSSIVWTYHHTKESMKDTSIQENLNLIYQGKTNLENYMDNMNRLTLSIYHNSRLMNIMKTSTSEEYASFDEIRNMLASFSHFNDHVEQVVFYIESRKQAFSTSKTYHMNARDMNPDQYAVYSEAKEQPGHMLIESNHLLHTYGLTEYEYHSNTVVFSIHRAIFDYPDRTFLGYLSIDLDTRQIAKMTKKLFNPGQEQFYLVDVDDDVLISSSSATGGDPSKWAKAVGWQEASSGYLDWEDEDFQGVIVYDRLAQELGGWTLIKMIPYDFLYEDARAVVLMNIAIGSLVLLLVVLATLFVSFKITNPIRILSGQMEEVKQGDLQMRFKSFGDDEIGRLGRTFQSMVETINDYINREYRWKLQNKTNQLKVLQSQINPHFLHNTLQSIGTLALQNNMKPIHRLLRSLSEIMRYSMNAEEDIVTIQKEVHHIQAYLKLQKQRFGDRFSYELDMDAADPYLMEALIPKMTLQPLVENYFKHGLDQTSDGGMLWIRVKGQKDRIHIEIEDNGAHVDDAHIEKLRIWLAEDDLKFERPEDSGIGLINVYRRLKLFYDHHAEFHIGRGQADGFKVSVSLPVTTREGDAS
ncbi:cache domain-containing sensor histidine kinase [Marinicrinis sediminis]|uniref:Sensor histidine kinase n=1 Tax=Marinicrinis sediminis TaxID=1652465 RepID=A0ABW5RGG6_9BACL